jgi:hypothetical protein
MKSKIRNGPFIDLSRIYLQKWDIIPGGLGRSNACINFKRGKYKKIWVLFLTIVSFSQLMSSHINWPGLPITLSSGTQDASDPAVRIDLNGNAVAVWVENSIVKSSKYILNQGWSGPMTLSNPGASDPQIVVDQSGNANAIWVENGIIKSSMHLFGGSWETSVSLSIPGASSPRIAVDLNGDVVGIWTRNGVIESSTKPFGGKWPILPDILAVDGADSPEIAIGADNRTVVAVWHAVSFSIDTIFSADKLISGKWSEGQILANYSVNPKVAVDPNGNAVAIWYQFYTSGPAFINVTLQGAPKPFDENWDASVNISRPGIRNPEDLVACVSFDGNSNAIALWNTSFDDSNFAIQSAILSANGNWSSPLDLVNLNLYAYDLDLSVDSKGDALAVYMLNTNSSLKIQSSESDISAYNVSWDTPATLSAGGINGFPCIAAQLNGNKIHAVAVWVKNNGVHNNIQSAIGMGKVLNLPLNLTVEQRVHNFGVFNEDYNTLSWQASSSPNVPGYLVFRNGVLINTVGPHVFQINDENRNPHESGTYVVAAFDSQNFQSSTVFINFPQ